MKIMKNGMCLLILLRWLVFSSVQAQPFSLEHFEQDLNQCLQAQTPQQCLAALPACERTHKALAARSPDEPNLQLGQARLLNDWAICEDELGRYAQAEGHLRIALALRMRLLGGTHPDVADSLNNLASVLENQGKWAEAKGLYQQALALRTKLLGKAHPDVADSLTNLAYMQDREGKFGEAEGLYRQALALKKKLLGGEHRDVARILNNLAMVLDNKGQYGEAEWLCRQALSLRRRLLGEEHREVAASLDNLAVVLNHQGKHGEAEGLCRQALMLRKKLLGAVHPSVALGQNNLAFVLGCQGKSVEAERLYRQALAVQKKLLSGKHPDVALVLNNLALLLDQQGRYGEAEALHRQALMLRKMLLGGKHPQVGESQNNLALVLEHQGKYGEAERLFWQSSELLERLLGAEHPELATSLENLALSHMQVASVAAAIAPLRRAAQIREVQLRATVSETRMQALVDDIRGQEDLIYGLLSQPKPEGVAELALSTALLRKGRVVEAGAAANRVVQVQRATPAVAQPFAEWQSVRQQREALLYGGPGALKPADYRQRLEALKQQAESLEHLLVADLPELQNLQPPAMDQIVAQVAARLPQDGALVELVWARPYQGRAGASGKRWGEPQYIALLLFPDRRIVAVCLGAAATIDPQVRALLAALSSPYGDAAKAGQAVYARVMKPLVDALAGRRDLNLSLDGTLSTIPFDALHDGTDYLLGQYRFHYLSSGRDLLRDAAQRAAGAPLVLGNPDFGKAEQKSAAAGPTDLYQRLSGLAALPGTQREVAVIGSLLGVAAQTGRAAREEVVRSAHAPRILHIATHGLFLRDVELPAPTGLERGLRSASLLDRPRSNIVAVPMAERLPGELGAMNRSALVLADAARGASAQDAARDGLLTADEARSLDLYGTQLVVLSACETGQGSVSAGQGIYGLRRAFLVAGAETLVTSLWRVSDAATGELMTAYYQKLLDKKKPGDRLGSLVAAMQEMRKRPGRAHPYYWAPFQVIGQDGPLH